MLKSVKRAEPQLTWILPSTVSNTTGAFGRRLAMSASSRPETRAVPASSTSAVISASATLGRGVAVMAGAVINAESQIGDLAIVNTGAVVDHDCRLGAACHLGPAAALAGGVSLGERAFLGVGARTIPGVTIGADSVVGAGGVVARDLPDGVLAIGVPAKIKGDRS